MKGLRMRKRWTFATLVSALAGCSGGPSGEYTDGSGAMTYNFRPGGTLEITARIMGMVHTVET